MPTRATAPLMAALTDVARRRPDVIAADVDVLATYRGDLSGGEQWRVAGARFFVVVVTERESPMDGVSVRGRGSHALHLPRDADAPKRRMTSPTAWVRAAMIFAVRPRWGSPAQEWIDADPEFWTR